MNIIKKRDKQLVIRIGKLRVAIDWSDDKVWDLWGQGIWVTANGLKIPVQELKSSHLVNVANLIVRQAWTEASKTTWLRTTGLDSSFSIPMVSRIDIAQVLLEAHPIWPYLDHELTYRNLTDQVKLPWRDK